MPYQHNPRITPVPKKLLKLNLIQKEIDSLLKTSNSSSARNSKGIYIHNLLGSKEIWRNATNNKPETFEQFCGNNSFQDGDSSNSSKFT